MCGRIANFTELAAIQSAFKIDEVLVEPHKSTNIAPSQQVPVIVMNGTSVVLDSMKWGLVPSWARDEKIGNRMINARAEGIEKKPSFSVPLKTKRCIIPVNGFFEWKEGIPHYITLKERELFGLAGLYDEWSSYEKKLRSFTIITTSPNDFMKTIHDRMPVILEKKDEKKWLSADNTNPVSFLKPSSEQLQSKEVSTQFNSTSYKGKI